MLSTSGMRGRNLKKRRYKAERAKKYREAKSIVLKALKKADEGRIEWQRDDIEPYLHQVQAESISAGEKDLTSDE